MNHSHVINFNFYAKSAKPLIQTLPSSKEKNLANAWIKRLSQDSSISDVLKNNYLKLLIYFLQMKKLDGPFLQHPNQFQVLEELPQNQNLFEITKGLEINKKKAYFPDIPGDLSTENQKEMESIIGNGSKKVMFEVSPTVHKTKGKPNNI